jgi:pimeloyl-ACP methyl ester carboxylesterase
MNRTHAPAPVTTLPAQFDEWQIELHGRRVIYRVAGSGPPVVLIHGMLNSSSHWREVALNLAREHTVIAPDLIGHGDSAAASRCSSSTSSPSAWNGSC